MNKHQDRHSWMMHHYYHHPNRLFEEPVNILTISQEYSCFLNGQLYVVPDLHISTKGYDYFFELKSSCYDKTIEKGRQQISRMSDWLIKNGRKDCSKLGLVYPRNYNLEDIIIERFIPK